MSSLTHWTVEEDEKLRQLVAQLGPKRWSDIAKELGSKGPKQCRRRWKNYLDAELKQGAWTEEEDRKLLEAHDTLGNKWTDIAKVVGGRTDNAVKNRFAALQKRIKASGGSRRKRPRYTQDGSILGLNVETAPVGMGFPSTSGGMGTLASPVGMALSSGMMPPSHKERATLRLSPCGVRNRKRIAREPLLPGQDRPPPRPPAAGQPADPWPEHAVARPDADGHDRPHAARELPLPEPDHDHDDGLRRQHEPPHAYDEQPPGPRVGRGPQLQPVPRPLRGDPQRPFRPAHGRRHQPAGGRDGARDAREPHRGRAEPDPGHQRVHAVQYPRGGPAHHDAAGRRAVPPVLCPGQWATGRRAGCAGLVLHTARGGQGERGRKRRVDVGTWERLRPRPYEAGAQKRAGAGGADLAAPAGGRAAGASDQRAREAGGRRRRPAGAV